MMFCSTEKICIYVTVYFVWNRFSKETLFYDCGQNRMEIYLDNQGLF